MGLFANLFRGSLPIEECNEFFTSSFQEAHSGRGNLVEGTKLLCIVNSFPITRVVQIGGGGQARDFVLLCTYIISRRNRLRIHKISRGN